MIDFVNKNYNNKFITVKDLLIRKVNYGNKMDRNKIDTVASYNAVKEYEFNTLDINIEILHQLTQVYLLPLVQEGKKHITILLLDDDVYTGITLNTGKDFLEAKLTHYFKERVLQLTCNVRPLTLHNYYLLDGIVENTKTVEDCVNAMLSDDKLWKIFD